MAEHVGWAPISDDPLNADLVPTHFDVLSSRASLPNADSREVLETRLLKGHHLTVSSARSGRNDQIVGSSWPAHSSYMRHQRGMRLCHLSLVRLDGQDTHNVIDESLSFCPVLRVSESNADE